MKADIQRFEGKTISWSMHLTTDSVQSRLEEWRGAEGISTKFTLVPLGQKVEVDPERRKKSAFTTVSSRLEEVVAKRLLDGPYVEKQVAGYAKEFIYYDTGYSHPAELFKAMGQAGLEVRLTNIILMCEDPGAVMARTAYEQLKPWASEEFIRRMEKGPLEAVPQVPTVLDHLKRLWKTMKGLEPEQWVIIVKVLFVTGMFFVPFLLTKQYEPWGWAGFFVTLTLCFWREWKDTILSRE